MKTPETMTIWKAIQCLPQTSNRAVVGALSNLMSAIKAADCGLESASETIHVHNWNSSPTPPERHTGELDARHTCTVYFLFEGAKYALTPTRRTVEIKMGGRGPSLDGTTPTIPPGLIAALMTVIEISEEYPEHYARALRDASEDVPEISFA